jgi:hypothetical protein
MEVDMNSESGSFYDDDDREDQKEKKDFKGPRYEQQMVILERLKSDQLKKREILWYPSQVYLQKKKKEVAEALRTQIRGHFFLLSRFSFFFFD